MKKITTIIVVTITLILFATPILAAPTPEKTARQKCEERKGDNVVCLNVPIGSFDRVNLDDRAFSSYIKVWYGFVIGTIGIFATVMIMWGGFKWLTSRGNSGTIGEAKEIIWSAIIGLALAFLSYTILNIFNPDLVVIKSLEFTKIEVKKKDDGNKLTPKQRLNQALEAQANQSLPTQSGPAGNPGQEPDRFETGEAPE